jgi:hypothetical protein
MASSLGLHLVWCYYNRKGAQMKREHLYLLLVFISISVACIFADKYWNMRSEVERLEKNYSSQTKALENRIVFYQDNVVDANDKILYLNDYIVSTNKLLLNGQTGEAITKLFDFKVVETAPLY